MTTEESRDSLDRAVEEVRKPLAAYLGTPKRTKILEEFEEAVRRQERERAGEGFERLKSALIAEIGKHVRPPIERARSSEEAGG